MQSGKKKETIREALKTKPYTAPNAKQAQCLICAPATFNGIKLYFSINNER